ncbi:MAG TPA: cysteine--tRNA ligase [Candidatus Binatia bacterium]
MSLRLHNTLSGAIEPLSAARAGEVGLYVCGPTVYDRCHLGHARSFIVFDVLVRYLRFAGQQVRFVRNVTDIDDKIIKRAAEQGVTAKALAERFIGSFHADLAALGCVMPDVEPRATEHLPEMIALIERLIGNGLAYPMAGDVYFAVGRFAGYGKLSKRKLDDLQAGARVEVDERKRDALDFALWKAAKPGEPSWESPWGPGRPGWHLECSAMSVKYLDQPFDLHGGGEDLIFPHHENEIAQSEGAAGKPFVRHWVHHAFVRINDEKMAKSLGNFLTIEETLKRVPAEAMRLFLAGTHYRSPLDFSEQGLGDAGRACARIHETIARLEDALGGAVAPDGAAAPNSAATPTAVQRFRDDFTAAMDDDLNSPRALGVLFDQIREINRVLDAGEREHLAAHLRVFADCAGVLGILRRPADRYLEDAKSRHLTESGIDPAEIERLIAERNAARKGRDFRRADEIRAELSARGIVLKDGADGTTWSKA